MFVLLILVVSAVRIEPDFEHKSLYCWQPRLNLQIHLEVDAILLECMIESEEIRRCMFAKPAMKYVRSCDSRNIRRSRRPVGWIE